MTNCSGRFAACRLRFFCGTRGASPQRGPAPQLLRSSSGRPRGPVRGRHLHGEKSCLFQTLFFCHEVCENQPNCVPDKATVCSAFPPLVLNGDVGRTVYFPLGAPGPAAVRAPGPRTRRVRSTAPCSGCKCFGVRERRGLRKSRRFGVRVVKSALREAIGRWSSMQAAMV